MGVSAACAGIGGHMATRFLFLVERIIESRLLKASVDVEKDDVKTNLLDK